MHCRTLWLLTLTLGLLAGCSRPVAEIMAGNVTATDVEPIVQQEGDWAWWRGPTHDGHATGPTPPLTWDRSQNVLWKAPLGSGHASPIVVGDQVIVAEADESAETMSLVGLDRTTGKRTWTCPLHSGGFMHKHGKNSHASATPACDGQRVFAVNMVQGAIWVTAVDLAGNQVWQTNAGPFKSMHGYGSSPLLYQGLVIVVGDNPGSGFLAALHRESGEVVWRIRRRSKPSFGTPVIARINDRDELLLSGHEEVISYDPLTGETLWSTDGPASTVANTPVWNSKAIFATGGYPQRNVMAISTDGKGEVLWDQSLKVYVPSPLLLGDQLILPQDNGVVRALAISDGREIWNKRFNGGGLTASPVVSGEHIFLPTEQGKIVVFQSGKECRIVAENDLAEPMLASPVICGGRLYLRTASQLYCIGQAEDQTQQDET